MLRKQDDLQHSFENQKQGLIQQISESRNDQNELRQKNEDLYHEIHRTVELNHHKNQELVRHINFLEQQLKQSNSLLEQLQQNIKEKDQLSYKDNQHFQQLQI